MRVEGLKNEIRDESRFFQVTEFNYEIGFSIRPPGAPRKKGLRSINRFFFKARAGERTAISALNKIHVP